ncbi:activating transcription factor of chaperone isoform X1 [Sitophilus oryzae]|uniref:Activating transcription factor of chaperone isoform X1 n=1 Tax=Sitophilus oryzae TaxID=7048 RepID=A0A6J2XF58_SITOR|nr:activating transcription factor of chaperone isoform X1 [Sitophilus oryzae]
MKSTLPWKEEPVSPLSCEEATELDCSFYETSLDYIKLEDENFETCESKAEYASQVLENLEKLVDLDDLIKDEPFLLDEKMLPLLDDVEPPRGAVAVPVPLKSEYYKSPEDNTFLLNELEKVYYELNHGTLTPPQSPPGNQPVTVTTLEPILGNPFPQIVTKDAAVVYSVPEKHEGGLAFAVDMSYASMPTPQPDIAHELAVVDELVRTRAEDIMQWNSSGPSSPDSSCNSSNFGDCSSDDPEWMPEPVEHYSTYEELVQKTQTRKRRSNPYCNSPDDKKSRKKEQNKNAATRYRMKKKAEVEEILHEEKQLLESHGELNTKITDLQREIKYLKGLMRDLLKAKGVIH